MAADEYMTDAQAKNFYREYKMEREAENRDLRAMGKSTKQILNFDQWRRLLFGK